MAKNKYRFNPETLLYDRVITTGRERMIKFGLWFAASIVIAIVYYAVYSRLYDTPKERILANQLENIKFNYQMLSQTLGNIDHVLSDIQKRDDDVYRTILESDPVPASMRQAGIGGVNRYEPLEGYLYSEMMIVASKLTDKIIKKLYIQSISYDELIPKAMSKELMALCRPAILPVSKNKVRSESSFGMRKHPIEGYLKMHTGMDFTADTGTEVYATGDGVVIKAANTSGGYGRMVEIDHGFGVHTLYGHLSKIGVLVGSEVKRGQIIGNVGSTGKSVGPHLHYEVIKNGIHVNPIGFFNKDLSPEEYVHMHEQSQKNEIMEIW
jgi:murein DD-endopeptidase MepM/ murein hydrolase activator NlpD